MNASLLMTLLETIVGPGGMESLLATGSTAHLEETTEADGRTRYWLVDVGDFRVSWYDEDVAQQALTLYRYSTDAMIEGTDAWVDSLEATHEFLTKYPPIEHGDVGE